MEHVALNNVQLDYLAKDDPQFKPSFYGTIACDRLPKNPLKSRYPKGTLSTPTRVIVPVNIGWRFGPTETSVKSWTVMDSP